MNRNIVKILNCNVDLFTKDEALKYICNNKGYVVTINPEMIECANNNSDFMQIVNSADLIIPDGIGVQIGLKILGYNITRIPGIDFGKCLIEHFYNENKSIALVGAKEDIITDTITNLKQEYKNINLIYTHNGYFSDDAKIYEEIIEKQPELLLVALGSPKQEQFIKGLKQALPNTVMIGLGGSFDVWSGHVDRAPNIYQKLGIEWLYRTLKEPKRIKRIFPTLPLFLLKILRERMFDNETN